MAHVPLFIDLKDRRIVIFGGGHVGERKAKMFCAYGLTTVVSTSFTAELLKMADGGLIDAIVDDLKDVKKFLTGAFIVVPATNNRTLNAFIADQAKAMNILVNQVDGIGEVIVPSIINKDNIHVGISTMGKSPTSARFLRLQNRRAHRKRCSYGNAPRQTAHHPKEADWQPTRAKAYP
jgi:siroheme synthase, N-terminal domain